MDNFLQYLFDHTRQYYLDIGKNTDPRVMPAVLWLNYKLGMVFVHIISTLIN